MQLTSEWLTARSGRFREDGYAFLSSYTAAYREWGRYNSPSLVLVPALAGGTNLLDPLASELGKHFHVIAYELRGEHDCFALRRRFDLGDLADDLREFCDQMGLERPLMVGVSFGAALAMEFAIRFPHRLGGLALQGADVRFKRTLIRQVAGQVLSGYPLPSDSPFVNQFFNLLFGGRPENPGVFDFVTRQAWRTDQGIMAHRFRLAEKLNFSKRLDRIRVPTLVLSGDRDLFVSKDGLAELQRGIPEVDYIPLRGAGHLAFVTHAPQMARLIRQFVDDVQ